MIEPIDDDLRALLDAERATDLGDLSEVRARVHQAVLDRVGPGGGGDGGADGPTGAGPVATGSSALGAKMAWLGATGVIATAAFFTGQHIGQPDPQIVEVERFVEVERIVEVPVPSATTPIEPAMQETRETDPMPRQPESDEADAETEAEAALGEERRLLDRARAALRGGRAHDALVALMEHERRFTNGAFTEERDRLVVEGLIETDRHDAARRRIERFLREHPRSVHRADVRAMGEEL